MRYLLAAFLSVVMLTTYGKEKMPKTIYQFKLAGKNGKTINLADYKGKKILIVNTPVIANNDPQYAELEQLYQKYQGKLMVIGILSDDFGKAPKSRRHGEEPEKEKVYNVTFPLAAMLAVNGDNIAPIYKWLTTKKYNKLQDSEVDWNFKKYLLDEKGKLIGVFSQEVKANDPQINAAITN